MRREKLPRGMFGTETELCQSLIDLARAWGYQAHAEVSDWDVVLVSRETGEQIGVQAKLRPSVDVLAQTLSSEHLPGPDVHAVLVPVASRAFVHVAQQLKILTLQGVMLGQMHLPRALAAAHRWKHPTREWTPDVEVLFPAGVPSPKRMTKWKLGAVKLCLLARERGYVTRADMRDLKLDHSWWFDKKFGPVLERRARNEYVLREASNPMLPDLRWPEVVTALLEAEKALALTMPVKAPRLRQKRVSGVVRKGRIQSAM